MRGVILLLNFFGACSSRELVQSVNETLSAPPEFCNTINNIQYNVPMKHTSAFNSLRCGWNAIITASGDKLRNLVRSVPRDCINGIVSLDDSTAVQVCNETNLNTISYYLKEDASVYNPMKPEATLDILNFVKYLRACYIVDSQKEQFISKFSPTLLISIRNGLDTFFQCRNLEADNDIHLEIMYQVITLISEMKEFINYDVVLAKLLTRIGNVWKFDHIILNKNSTHSAVLEAMYENFYNSHGDKLIANEYFCKPHLEVAQSLSDFLDNHSDLVGTANSWTLHYAALELGRFAKYPCIYLTISTFLKKQLKRYNDSSAPKVYFSLLDTWEYYDGKNCQIYGFCNFKAKLKNKILPYIKLCDKTYMDIFKIRAQQISDAEADEVCKRLKNLEIYFHNLVNDQWRPVHPDKNVLIEVVIFKNVDEYKFFAAKLFGVGTDNGGIYLEGNPAKPGNIARYFCYEQSKNGKFDIWNLEHEFTHYLDGRYNMLGAFSDFQCFTSSGHIVWWLEGFSEYAANKNNHPHMVESCRVKAYNLSTIFSSNYNSGVDQIYHYGYLAVRFMLERHHIIVDDILDYFRVGRYKKYDDFMAGIGFNYDQEFSEWCDCIAYSRHC